MCSHRGFSFNKEHLRRPPCPRNSPWSGNCIILCLWRLVRSYPSAMYYSGYFEMGKYDELSSEGECALCTVGSLFWHNFLGCGCLSFQRRLDGTSVSFDKQDLSGNVMHNKTWKDVDYYYQWTLLRSTWSYPLLSGSAVQDCTFLGVAILDIGDGWNSLFLY